MTSSAPNVVPLSELRPGDQVAYRGRAWRVQRLRDNTAVRPHLDVILSASRHAAPAHRVCSMLTPTIELLATREELAAEQVHGDE